MITTNVRVQTELGRQHRGSSTRMHAAGDGETFWLEIGGLTPGESYRYQYQILPDDIRVADAYAEVILDQWNDPWIPESTYPNLLPYPANETSGL